MRESGQRVVVLFVIEVDGIMHEHAQVTFLRAYARQRGPAGRIPGSTAPWSCGPRPTLCGHRPSDDRGLPKGAG
eukprot:9264116-Heterocapsa_arctica.AAC.1